MAQLLGKHPELDSRDIIADFYPAFTAEIAGQWSTDVGMLIDSDSETENYKWPGAAPGLREWVGGRREEVLKKFAFSLTNVDYEDTLPLPLADLRRDKTGMLRRRVAEMARKAAQHWNVLLSALIETNGAAYDGNDFFDNDHDESGSNQVNLLTTTEVPSSNVVTALSPTVEEAVDVLMEIVGHMYSYKDDKGDPINGDLKQFQVQVNSAPMWAAFRSAVTQAQLDSGETNRLSGLTADGINFRVVFNTRLTSTSDSVVYVFATDGILRPFILQDEVPVTTQLLGAGSDYEFDNKGHKFGLNATRNVGYGQWQHATKTTLT